jgi:hypothetical protein
LETTEKRTEAVELLNKLQKEFGNSVNVHNNMGILQMRAGD